MRKRFLLSLATMAPLLLCACKSSAPPNAAAQVNTRTITYSDIDKQLELQNAGSQEKASGDELSIRKLELLRTLVDQEIMLQRAEKLSLMATEADVDGKLNELKAPYTKDEFQKQLDMRKMSVDDLKAQIRRDLSVQKLFNKEITSRISITDGEITDYYNANKKSFNLAEPQMRLAQIVVTPARDANVRNLKNDDAATEDAAKNKIQTLEARLRQNEDFNMLAQNFSEDPASAPNGGDLGWIRDSDLEKADPMLRRVIASLQPGQITSIIRTPDGYRVIKLLLREPSGQRELGDPKVQQNIRESLMNRKDQLLRAAYYEVARNESKVTNYYAETVFQNKSQTK
ncbi:MAG: peptidylprolyl isomerase [Bryobacteraceae bacterium]|nr:peptidylprolyl isomerase [Bryobacteraceae bacterium]